MKDKKIHLVLFFSVVIFLGIISFLFFSGLISLKKTDNIASENIFNNNTTSLPKTDLNSSSTLSEIFDTALSNGDASLCLYSSNEKVSDACVLIVAGKTKDSKDCSLIKDQVKMTDCLDQVLYWRAIDGYGIKECFLIKKDDLARTCFLNAPDRESVSSSGNCDGFPEREKIFCQDFLVYSSNVSASDRAKTENDCQQINDSFLKDYCLYKVSQNSN